MTRCFVLKCNFDSTYKYLLPKLDTNNTSKIGSISDSSGMMYVDAIWDYVL